MRWVKAALFLGFSAALAVAAYVVMDNIAVPAAVTAIGLVCACMTVALAGDSGSAPPPNPRAAGAAPAPQPDRAGWPQRDTDPDSAVWREAQRR